MSTRNTKQEPRIGGSELSGKLDAVCKHCGDKIKLYGDLWLDSGKVFPQYCRSSAGGQLHKAANKI